MFYNQVIQKINKLLDYLRLKVIDKDNTENKSVKARGH